MKGTMMKEERETICTNGSAVGSAVISGALVCSWLRFVRTYSPHGLNTMAGISAHLSRPETDISQQEEEMEMAISTLATLKGHDW